jgi:hypothetical protein
LINEYCLIGEVNWDRVLQIDIPLALAVEPANARNSITVLRLRN